MTPERLREIATGAVLRGDFLTEETQEVAYALFAYADLLKAQAPPEATGLQVDWSFIRRVLEQGAAIQQDYAAGKYPTYEHFSARIDEAARERLATISAPVEPQGWQPIETAPRDGSRILLCANLQVKDRIGAGRYSVEPYISDGRGIIGAAEGFQGDGDQCIPSNQDVFTHWQPLPSEPSTKAGS